MERPTLEEQIRVSKMTREELIECLMPSGSYQRFDFWVHNHCILVWRVINWNWFDIWEGIEDADKYRSWEIKLKRKLFGGNKP